VRLWYWTPTSTRPPFSVPVHGSYRGVAW
jgi:hypothetical protein